MVSGNRSGPNILLVVADTARADDAYATNPSIMPTLQTFSQIGTRFDAAFASAPWTLPSHAGLFTGTYSSKHGAHGDHPFLDDTVRTLAEGMAATGYETFAASNNTWISGEFGFNRGFETFWKGWQLIQSHDDVGAIVHELGPLRRAQAALTGLQDGNPFVNAVNALYNQFSRSRQDYGATRTTDRVASWLDERPTDRPFFAFINYLEPHIRYQPPRAFAEPFLPADATYAEARAVRQSPRAYDVGEYELSTHELAMLRGLYCGELAYVDEQLRRLRSILEATGEWEDTIVIVAGDHGENIGDHGFLGHQYNLYDTLLHVPLVVTGGPFEGGGRRDDLVQLTDIVPTLIDVTGMEDSELITQAQGTSFHPDATSQRSHIIAEYMAPQPPIETLNARFGDLPTRVTAFDRRLRTIRTADEKLIRGSDGHLEYYNLHRDPTEGTDRTNIATDRVSTLSSHLDDWLASFEQTTATGDVQMSKQTEQRLTDLGYL